MKRKYPELAELSTESADTLVKIQLVFQQDLDALKPLLNTDLSHISHFASPTGDIQIERIERLKESRFILHYQMGWQINYSCADQTASGQIKEKLHFILEPDGTIIFKPLKLEA